MTSYVAPVQQIVRQHALHPLMIVIGILLVACAAKFGHAMLGIGGMVSFYPLYVTAMTAWRTAGAAIS